MSLPIFNKADVAESLKWCELLAKSGAGTGNAIRDKANSKQINQKLSALKGEKVIWRIKIDKIKEERIDLYSVNNESGSVFIRIVASPNDTIGLFNNTFYIVEKTWAVDKKWRDFAIQLNPDQVLEVSATIFEATYGTPDPIFTSSPIHFFDFKLFQASAKLAD